MELILLWFGLSILAAVIAGNKGRSGFGFFLLSILLSPLIGIIAALVVADGAAVTYTAEGTIDRNVKTCPHCAETIKAAAIVCKHCGRDLPSQNPSDAPIEEPAANALMKKYGITYNEREDKYRYKDYSYDDLRNAVSYAKNQTGD